jgi:hypothetical protein
MPGKSQPERRHGSTRVYQAMPSLRDIDHDGWYNKHQLEIPSARSWAAPIRAANTVRKRQAVRPVHHVQDHTYRVTLLQPARRAAVLDQPSTAFGLIGLSSHLTQIPRRSSGIVAPFPGKKLFL